MDAAQDDLSDPIRPVNVRIWTLLPLDSGGMQDPPLSSGSLQKHAKCSFFGIRQIELVDLEHRSIDRQRM